MKTVDVAIIGAGSAGLSARRQVEKKTQDYVVIDPGKLGTTCARVGCMPSKVFIQGANDFYRRHTFETQGILNGDSLELNSPHFLAHVRSLRDRFVRSVTEGMERWQKTKLIQREAKFIDLNTLDLGDEKLKAKQIIIATGSSPILPEAWKSFQSFFETTDSFFELETLPSSMGVIGMGVIGTELGQALTRLGVKTSLFSRGKQIGGLTDPAVIESVQKTFSQEMSICITEVKKLSSKNKELVIQTEKDEYHVEKALLSLGRRPNLKSLNLENLPIKLDARGIPIYNKNTMRIQDTPLLIAGDVTGDQPILHEASDEGNIAGYNATHHEDVCFERRTPFAITFSSPQIAVVGKTFKELQERKIDFKIGKISYAGQGRAIVKLEEKGLVHIYGCSQTGQLLGAELFAPDAEHLAHWLASLIQLKQTVRTALSLPFYHPVLEEGLRTALRELASQLNISLEPLELVRCEDSIV